ncbi:hypothetical protein Bpfe_017941 [Biomphalaria pfeifferi]|uniref:Uncharacterized protein n=1 Tax=Biomphalaria pfeifferi TaxID=112525 RepID=A0AAD8BE11_BIOPF|nr:hypothetical protein Bpfe_017941 [Biomphalaria pfeifferi]
MGQNNTRTLSRPDLCPHQDNLRETTSTKISIRMKTVFMKGGRFNLLKQHRLRSRSQQARRNYDQVISIKGTHSTEARR